MLLILIGLYTHVTLSVRHNFPKLDTLYTLSESNFWFNMNIDNRIPLMPVTRTQKSEARMSRE